MMDSGVAFGAGKAGQAFDPISFVIRPQVILRFVCWVFSIVVFCCIYSKGWYENKCLYNGNGNACRFGTLVAAIGFLASIALLAIEALFQNLSSIKMRRRVVAFDLSFSAVWSVLYFICFIYLAVNWGQSNFPPFGIGVNSLRTAVVFSFFSIFVWAGCAYFGWLRWKSGADMSQFASGFEGEDAGGGYASYAAGADGTDVGYQEGMYTGPIDQFQGNYPAPTY